MVNHKARTTQAPLFVYDEMVATKASIAKPAAERRGLEAAVGTDTFSVGGPASAPLPIIPPRIISQVLPIYPESAIQSGAAGVVIIEAAILSTGNLGPLKVNTTSGIAELDQAVVTAVSQWKFSAATQGGAAIASVFKIPIRFVLR
ncbi:energy transducer TonB [Candidatus Saganbacteria bacterium]|nr:energy transducer TonB [Candidatus Saganbacteria bacterium]